MSEGPDRFVEKPLLNFIEVYHPVPVMGPT